MSTDWITEIPCEGRLKTFDEAMEARMVKNRADYDRIGADVMGRFAELMDELANNDYTHDLVASIIADELGNCAMTDPLLGLQNMVLGAFINGVMIGIEMEKA